MEPTESLDRRDRLSGAEDSSAPGSILFIGNATVLIRWGGFAILTDPTFIHKHEQVSIGYGMQATRLTDPALEIHQLPPLDVVVLSHFHGDHFDQIAERELDKSLPIVTTPQAAQELRERGFHNPEPLETWEVWERFKGDASVRITAMPGRHGPVLANFLLPEVMGSRVELISPAGRLSIYISGDTLIFDAVKKIPRRYPHCDLALLHLGGTRILGVLVTMDAAQGLEMMRLIDADLNIPIHYDDYDVFKSSLAEFDREVAQAGLADKVRHLNRGETYEFALRPRHRERRS